MQPILFYHPETELSGELIAQAARVYMATQVKKMSTEKATSALGTTPEEIERLRYLMALDTDADGKRAWETMQGAQKTLLFLHDDGAISDETGKKYPVEYPF